VIGIQISDNRPENFDFSGYNHFQSPLVPNRIITAIASFNNGKSIPSLNGIFLVDCNTGTKDTSVSQVVFENCA
jgi:hypothetical protein